MRAASAQLPASLDARATKDRDRSSQSIVAEEGFSLSERRDGLIGAIQSDEGRSAIVVRPWIFGAESRGLVRELDRARSPFFTNVAAVSPDTRVSCSLIPCAREELSQRATVTWMLGSAK